MSTPSAVPWISRRALRHNTDRKTAREGRQQAASTVAGLAAYLTEVCTGALYRTSVRIGPAKACQERAHWQLWRIAEGRYSASSDTGDDTLSEFGRSALVRADVGTDGVLAREASRIFRDPFVYLDEPCAISPEESGESRPFPAHVPVVPPADLGVDVAADEYERVVTIWHPNDSPWVYLE